MYCYSGKQVRGNMGFAIIITVFALILEIYAFESAS